MQRPYVATFNTNCGSLTWTLPPYAVASMSEAPADVQEQVLRAMSANLVVFCTAMLSCFGNPAKIDTMQMIMLEIKEIAEK